MVEAVIFDMDGLLVDSEPVWDQARRDMARLAGQTWTQDDHRACMGVSTLEWAGYMVQRLALTMTSQEVADAIIARMVELYSQQIPFLPGALAAVDLAAQHFPTAVASGSPRLLLDTVVNSPALRGKFQVVLDSDGLRAGKPAPDVYLETARRLGIPPERCVCLEDSANGILAGKRAGMAVIAVPDPRFPPARPALEQADVVLRSLEEFNLPLLLGL